MPRVGLMAVVVVVAVGGAVGTSPSGDNPVAEREIRAAEQQMHDAYG